MELVGKISGKRVLDVGCGFGFISEELAKENEVYGLDISHNNLRLASELGLKTKRWDIQKGLPFESDFFDFVLATEILEHIFDTDALLSEIRRVLKKDGILIVSVPNCCSLASRINVLLGRLPSYVEYCARPGMAGHIRGYNLPSIRAQLLDNGFELEDERTNAICFWRFLISWPWHLFRSLGEILIIKARKK